MASWTSSNRSSSSTFTTTSSTTDTSFTNTSSSRLIGIHSPDILVVSNSEASPFQQYGAAQSQTEEADKENGGCCRNMASAVLDHFVMFSGLAMATYIGVSSRIGLSVFSEWDGIMHFPSFWAQVVGTLIIGIAVANKDMCSAFLYTLLTTGVCGSMTTFSSWNVEASKVLLQLNDTSFQPIHNSINGGRIVGFLTILLLGIGMPVSVFLLGKNFAVSNISLFTNNFRVCQVIQRLRSSFKQRPWLRLVVYLTLYAWTTAAIVALCLHHKHYFLLFSLILGGPGTYVRWKLGTLDKKDFKYIRKFPLGTFLANTIGSIILVGTLIAISHSNTNASVGKVQIAAMQGLAVGFCGSLTTVSTFVSQICDLPFCMSVIYVLTSIFTSQLLMNSVLLTYSVVTE